MTTIPIDEFICLREGQKLRHHTGGEWIITQIEDDPILTTVYYVNTPTLIAIGYPSYGPYYKTQLSACWSLIL